MGIVRAPLLLNEPSGQVIKGSLRFNGTNHYLSRSFGSGNRRTWTWSAWVKRHKFGATNYGLFSYYPGSGNGSFIRFSDDSGGDTLRFYSDTNTRSIVSSAQFRDPSAWYNIVISVDTTKKQDYERVRRYVNGVRQYDNASNTWPTEDEELLLNQSGNHYLGRVQASAYGPVSMSNVNFIDGLALGPEYFGFTDPLTGTWRPKKFRAVGTTVNDGTDWSANFSGNGGTQPSTAFDGDGPRQNGYVHSGSELVVNFDPPLSGHIIVYGGTGAGSHNSVTTDTFTLSDGSVLSSQEKYDVAPYFNPLDFGEKKNITSLTCSAGYTLYAVEVDGVFLKDSTTENLDFGTNGFYLPMDNEDDFEIDKSGKGNNWTKNNFSGTSIDPDVLKDSPSGAVSGGRAQTGITTTSSAPSNYATLNPVNETHGTLSEGNLKAQSDTSGQYSLIPSTLLINKTGKFYWEAKFNIGSSDAKYATIGICSESRRMFANEGLTAVNDVGDYSIKGWDGGLYTMTNQSVTYNNGSNHSNTLNDNDVVSLAFNADNGKLWFGINGTYLTNAAGVGNPSLDLNPDLTVPTNIGHYPAFGAYNSGGNSSQLHVNFGQKPFKYEPPKGFLPLNSATVRPNKVIPRPEQYVGVTTYTGTGSLRNVNVGMQPDLVWIKRLDDTQSHIIVDVLRGSTKELNSDGSGAQGTFNRNVTAFNSDGFRVWDGNPNGTDFDLVAWTWKAGGSKNTFNVDDVGYASAAAAGITEGTLSLTGASIGTKQGFSICTFNSPAAYDGSTWGHGLTQSPDFVIMKHTGNTGNWQCYHSGIPSNYMQLNSTNGAKGSNNWTITSTTATCGSGLWTHNNTTTVAYHWHNVPGLQKFGVYRGNNSDNGAVVELGFRPALVIIKRTTSDHSNGGWYIYDSSRDPINSAFNFIVAESDYAERRASNNSAFVNTYYVDFLSNGFKLRNNATNANRENIDYIYMAWAEAPASNLFGGQSNAR